MSITSLELSFSANDGLIFATPSSSPVEYRSTFSRIHQTRGAHPWDAIAIAEWQIPQERQVWLTRRWALCLPNQRPVTHRPRSQPDPKQHVEGDTIVPSPIPSEDEFIEVRLQVGATEAVVDAERQPLEIGEDAVNPRQQHVRRHHADRLW
jgi:hypothetical protein